MPHRRRWSLCLIAALLMISCLVPAASVAAPATKLYVGQFARLTAQIPRPWTADPTGSYDDVGSDGFVASLPLPGPTLAAACAAMATSPFFDPTAAVTDTTWAGQPACRLSGRKAGTAIAALVVPHPHPFALYGTRYAFAALLADPAHFDAIAATLDFSPDRVTPEAYITGVLDLAQARAYWGGQVDWPQVRQAAGEAIAGLPTVAMARQGLFATLLQNLQAAGDNHSFVRYPDQVAALGELSGFGALVGGPQVLRVYPDGPAARAGVREGDLLAALDGQPFAPTAAPTDPAWVPATAYALGTPVAWTVRRAGAPAPITVTVTEATYSPYLPPTGRRLPGDVGYIALPGFTSPGKETAYAAAGRNAIAAADQSPTCGWVVDLRLDFGGSYGPMVTAVGPLLGNGVFVGWRDRDGHQAWVTYQNGRILDNGAQIADFLGGHTYGLRRPRPPVAVLVGPSTASAGEATALAVVGRPETRLFGETSAGQTTGVQSHLLFDGTDFALATAAMTDRTGATHLTGVVPDQQVATDWTTYGTAQDPVLAAALAWLRRQPACRQATPNAGR